MPQSFACLNFHIVFSVKHRQPEIDPKWEDRLCSIFGGILRERKGMLLAAGGVADHVHLLVSLPRDLCVADAVREIKTASAKWIHETFPERRAFAWQRGYAAFSTSYS